MKPREMYLEGDTRPFKCSTLVARVGDSFYMGFNVAGHILSIPQ